MTIEWDPTFSVGIAEIDAQHQTLFRRLNELEEAISQTRGRAEIAKTLDFLERYVSTHFSAEEQQMTDCGYAECEAHILEHQLFGKLLTRLRDDLASGGASKLLLIELSYELGNWLSTHVLSTDLAFGAFVSKQNLAP